MTTNNINFAQKDYFAAANSAYGFYNLFDKIFSPEKYKHIYILKGGPGCGKSTTMKRISEKAKSLGYNVENYYCSSSPISLDGVIIPELSVAVVDGTAPHTFDPTYPGSCENIINLGAAWNIPEAEANDNEIRSLTLMKRNAYSKAYAYLSAASNANKILQGCSKHYIIESKLGHSVERLCSKLKFQYKEHGNINYVFTDCISSSGTHHLFTFENLSKTKYFIKDFGGLSEFFFKYLKESLVMRGADITVALNPMEPNNIVGIYIESIDTCFTMYDDDYALSLDRKQILYKIINTQRFCNNDKYKKQRTFYKYAEKSKNILINGAKRELECAGRAHDELEKIYYSITDYSVIEKAAEELSIKIFK